MSVRRRALSARLRRWLLIAPPYLWLAAFFLLPLLIVFRISLSDAVIAAPPYAPRFDGANGVWLGLGRLVAGFDFESYFCVVGRANDQCLIADAYILRSFVNSVGIALVSTAMTLVVGYPIALGVARAPSHWRGALLVLAILPFWTSFLIRVYALESFIGVNGPLNAALVWLGVVDAPLRLVDTTAAVYVGIVYSYLPFMTLPIYAALSRMDVSLLEAAEDLGASRRASFWLVTAPLSLPGVVAGCMLVFIPAVGEFVIPDLLGGGQTLMIGRALWTEFFNNRSWPIASAVAVGMLVALVLPIMIFQRQTLRRQAAEAGA